MLEAFREDVRLVHALKYQGRRPTWATSAVVVARSRGLLLLAGHRASKALLRWSAAGKAARLGSKAARLLSVFLDYWIHVLTKSEIRSSTAFESGVYLSDKGGIIVGARKVGAGTIIHHDVTIGLGVIEQGAPEIGRDVWIGPEAVIAGDITIGDGATILPSTVVTRDVPAGFVVQGNPPQFIRRRFDNAPLRRTLATDVVDLVRECPEA